MRFHIFLVGLLSIVVQVVLLRELSAAFYGVDLIYLLALGAWLLWTAAGAFVSGRTRSGNAALWFVAVGVVVPLDVALIRGTRLLLGGVPGAYLPLPAQIAASVLCLLPPALLLGLLFQRTATRYMGARSESSLARAYAIESVGGLAGGAALTWALHLSISSAMLAVAASVLAFAGSLFADERNFRTSGLSDLPTFAAVAGLLACLVAALNVPVLDSRTASWDHPDVVENLDSPYGRVIIERRAGQVSVYENGALTLDSQGTAAEEFVHLSLLQHPAPRRVLLLGGASAGLLQAAVQHGADRLDDVELDERVVESLARHLGSSFARARSAAGVRLWFDDPRRFVSRPGAAYDVIVLAASEPASAQANRLFTREFFAACAARLGREGVLSLRLPSIENAWTPPLVSRTGAIHAALREVFADVVVLPGSTNLVLASPAPLVRDPRVLADRFTSRGIHARLVSPRYIRYLYSNDRYGEIRSLLGQRPVASNTDANPTSYQATTMLWLSKFVPSAARVDLTWAPRAYGARSLRSWAVVASAACVAVVWRRRRWPRRALVVATAACVGMLLESVLLLQYQLKQGVIFRDLGLLLMAVMAGLAAGAWIVCRAHGPVRRHVVVSLAGLLLLGVATSAVAATGYASGAVSIALMLFATGAAVSGVFAGSSVNEDANAAGAADIVERERRRFVATLYGADVLGGCLGSVAASLVLIPLLGLAPAAAWAAMIAAVGLLLA